MDYELKDKIRSLSVLTSEGPHDNFLSKQTTQKISARAIFHVNCQNLVNKNGFPRSR